MRTGLALALVALATLPGAGGARAADAMARSMAGGAGSMGNVELFLALRAHDGSSAHAPDDAEEDDWALGDLVFSADRGRLRLMGEYNVSTVEHDFERLQVGIEPVPDTLVWFGRFHQPGSAWNNEYHHGPYLQTSVSRPAIERWEDEEGIIPQHLVGVLAESRWPVGAGQGLRAQLGVGYGSAIDHEGLDPISVITSSGRGHHVSTTAQFAWFPTYLGQTSAGLLFGEHLSSVADAGMRARLQADAVRERVVGLYGDWVGERYRLLAVAYHLDLQLDGSGPGLVAGSESWWSGYLQGEAQLPHAFTAFGRLESSPGAGGSRAAATYADDLVRHGVVLGVRLDLAHRQAITLEAERATRQEGSANRVVLQWSAALP